MPPLYLISTADTSQDFSYLTSLFDYIHSVDRREHSVKITPSILRAPSLTCSLLGCQLTTEACPGRPGRAIRALLRAKIPVRLVSELKRKFIKYTNILCPGRAVIACPWPRCGARQDYGENCKSAQFCPLYCEGPLKMSVFVKLRVISQLLVQVKLRWSSGEMSHLPLTPTLLPPSQCDRKQAFWRFLLAAQLKFDFDADKL